MTARGEGERVKWLRMRLLDWARQDGRTFPWRRPSATNYEKVIAEVFLRRTQADTVAWFLPKFARAFPSWRSLARATRGEIADAVAPIGLSESRSRTLVELAQLANEQRGRLPRDPATLRGIYGVGNYTANAILLVTYSERRALVDSNADRVIRRFMGTDADATEVVSRLVEVGDPVEINWAMLDFAAVICSHRAPACATCTLRRRCPSRRL